FFGPVEQSKPQPVLDLGVVVGRHAGQSYQRGPGKPRGTFPNARAGDPHASFRLRGMVEHWTICHFAKSNPAGVGQGDVPSLLRSVADSIESRGDVQVEDITFATEVTDGEDSLRVSVYYHRQPRRR